ncbi:MAG: twitching motility protein PilT [Gammaproteobacteria bacterium RIFCSPHIGHO2_12_FULL_42_10]|nr:MAG: twitching motility protein PilT [Gammaproteobacteria bacterium RIFCSPHIGHO2_12_FULL_42_10]
MKLLLDSVILIDHFNNIQAATGYIRKHQKNIAISVITRAEVLAGFHQSAHTDLAKRLLDRFILYPIYAAEADLGAHLRKQYGLKLPDALQAAIAMMHQLTLVTRNTKDFNPKKHPFVMVPYVL